MNPLYGSLGLMAGCSRGQGFELVTLAATRLLIVLYTLTKKMGRGRKGGNPEILAKPLYGEPMAEGTLGVRLPVYLDEYVRSLPNRSEWVREAIAEKWQRETQSPS
jgi:hypothetical protein